jgi:hypothetical protein
VELHYLLVKICSPPLLPFLFIPVFPLAPSIAILQSNTAFKRSTRLFDEVKKDTTQYRASENAIFVMTDLVPTKDASTTTFINTVRKNATDRLYTSIIGIGAVNLSPYFSSPPLTIFRGMSLSPRLLYLYFYCRNLARIF